jgi:hypothetical protein
MKEKLTQLKEGIPYIPGAAEYVIFEDDSIEDILRHLIFECQGDKEHIKDLLDSIKT